MSDIAKIAAGLSEAQRDALAHWPNGHFTHRTRVSLRKRELVEWGCITPLGLAVRAYLESQP
jgi:hypothetical protein